MPLRLHFFIVVLVAIVAAVASHGDACGQSTVDPAEPLAWWGDVDGFLNQQHRHTLSLVDAALRRFPPEMEEPLERRMALLMVDNVMHERNAAQKPAVQQFLHDRIQAALANIQNTRPHDGAVIWKLYNHGFIVRTPSVAIAFDLVRAHSAGAEGFALADDTLVDLVSECDALFISHRHSDHADEFVAQDFIRQGKPVVAPPEAWSGKSIHGQITHLERKAHSIQRLDIRGGEQTLRVINYPGHQSMKIQNNVTLVITPEELAFVHTGDQSNAKDFSWIDAAGGDHRVDVLIPNCWTPNITRVIEGFKPNLVITGHENEMGHTIDHREPYWLTYVRLRETKTPHIIMTWGESFRYKREP